MESLIPFSSRTIKFGQDVRHVDLPHISLRFKGMGHGMAVVSVPEGSPLCEPRDFLLEPRKLLMAGPGLLQDETQTRDSKRLSTPANQAMQEGSQE